MEEEMTITEAQLNEETKMAMARAVTGVAGFFIGKAITQRTGIKDMSMVGLLFGYALAPALIKSLYKDQIG